MAAQAALSPGCVVRSLAVIVWAILASRPDLPEADAGRYAKALQAAARKYKFDPLTGIAIIQRESGFRANIISPDGEDYGLGQIRARYIGACKADEDPLLRPSLECEKVKQSLLDPETNIWTMAELIRVNRRFCVKKTGSALLQQWLASYQGRNYPKKRRWCKAGRETWAVIRYRRGLLKGLAQKPRERVPNSRSTRSASDSAPSAARD